MKVVIPQYRGRISPVFDTCAVVLAVRFEAKEEVESGEHSLEGMSSLERVRFVISLKPDWVLCAGISRPLHTRLINAGISVRDCIVGDIPSVLAAFLCKELDQTAFLMPGCGRGKGMGRGSGGRSKGRRGERGRGGGRQRAGRQRKGGRP